MSGIIAVTSDKEDVNKYLLYGLYALQHRGQLEAGLAIMGDNLYLRSGQGQIKDVLDQNEIFAQDGRRGMAHVKYGLYEEYEKEKISLPYYDEKSNSLIAIDGNILNEDFDFQVLIEKLNGADEELSLYINSLKGAFSLVYMDENKLIAIRDRWGLKPLNLSNEREKIIVASESCALDSLSASAIREINPGEILIYEKNTLRSFYYGLPEHKTCAFEYIYISRPDSYMMDKSIYKLRNNLGKTLYEEKPTDADIVIGAPDSGLTAAIGYAEASKIPYKDGIIKNRYIGRTFINPKDSQREKDVYIKLNPIREILDGKRVILVDDSIIKGVTIKRTVEMLKNAGAKEVHVRISAPQVINYCNLSLDMPIGSKLIARDMDVEEIRKEIKADSLYFLSLDGLQKNLSNIGICTHCFDGKYPIKEM